MIKKIKAAKENPTTNTAIDVTAQLSPMFLEQGGGRLPRILTMYQQILQQETQQSLQVFTQLLTTTAKLSPRAQASPLPLPLAAPNQTIHTNPMTASAGRAPRTKNIQGGSEDSCSKPNQETCNT